MVFFWRGFGLIVPIVVAICAWIVGYWYDDHSVGNKSYSGWVSFYCAIGLLLPGLAMWGGTEDEDGTRRKHDFMFVPVLIWALLFGGLSAYCLFTRDSVPDEDENTVAQTEETVTEEEEVIYHTVNFINSSDDTLDCIIKNAKGSKTITVNPHAWQPMDLVLEKFTFDVSDRKGNVTASFSTDKLTAPSKSQMDYESGWVQLDNGGHKLVLVDVMPMMPADFKSSNLKEVDWTKQVVAVYDGKSYMEPKVPKETMYNSRVLEPGDLLPSKLGTDETCYALITVPGDAELDNEFYIERFKELYFE